MNVDQISSATAGAGSAVSPMRSAPIPSNLSQRTARISPMTGVSKKLPNP